MKFMLMAVDKSTLDLALPALAAAAALLIVFLLFTGRKKTPQSRRRTPPPAPRSKRSEESLYADRAPAGSGSPKSAPLFLLLGPANSGKTALLDGLRHVFSSRDRTWISDLASGMACWHLAGGQVLEIAGNIFGRPAKGNGNGAEKEWKSLLSHLERHRPQRPLDGIVLALPSTHLSGEEALSADELQGRAAQAAAQLKQLRDQLGFCLPVYVVITKCDAIPGCAAFVRAQLTPHVGEIFGWSNPYSLDAPFDPAWTAQAFTEVNRVLSSERARFFAGNASSAVPASQDELFLFPSRLAQLQRPLKTYLEALFHDSGHRDGLLFRGIYFSGSAPYDTEQFDETRATQATHRVGFTSDLFARKIFPERGLARPLETAFAHRNTKLHFLRAACMAGALLLLSGTAYSGYSLYRASGRVDAHLWQIRTSLSQGKAQRDTATAYSTIYAAQALSGSNFRSIFLPASLVDPLHWEIEKIMPPAFNQLVYPGLQMGLERNADTLMRGACDTSSEDRASAAPPQSQEANAAQSLSDFTDAFLNLEDNIVLYDGLAPAGHGTGKNMLKLAGFLSPGTFAGLSTRSTSGLDGIVRASSGKSFNGCPWNRPAAAKLEMLATNALRQSVNEDKLLGALNALTGKINQLEENQLETYDDLNSVLQSFSQVQTYLAAPDLQWIAWKEDGGPMPPELSRSLDRIFSRPAGENVLLCDAAREKGPCACIDDLKSSIETMGREHLVKIRTLLLNARTETTGPLITAADSKLQFSKEAASLQTVLGYFLKLPFVAHEGKKQLAEARDGEQLFWNKDRLQAANQDKQAYDQFFGSQLANTSPNLQDTFDEVALSRLEANMVDSTASAQHFEPLPAGENLLPATLNEARSFEAAAPSLGQVLQQFSELNFDESYQDLLRVSTMHAQLVLARLDRAFDAQRLYWPADGKFDAWSGKSLPSAAVYALHSPDEIAAYLVSRRQEVEQYVAAAQPLVQFLQQHNGNPKQRALLAKWQSIINDLKSYQSAPAGSGLGSLEDYFANVMDKTAPPECQSQTPAGASNQVYFVQVRRSLEHALAGRCRSLLNQSAFQQYNDLAKSFNQRLAGKFPFASLPLDPAAPEATPEDVLDFYRQLDANGKAIRLSLQNPASGSADSIRKTAKFLDQMEALRPLFASMLNGQPGALPAFDLAPMFRVNRNYEINGNQIIDWNLQVGENTFRNFDPPSTGRWTYRDPVKITLRWAKDSPQQPVPLGPATANSNTRTVTFEYHDPWALLRMLVEHTAASTDFDHAIDPDPQTAVFIADQENVPRSGKGQPPAKESAAGQAVKVFIRVRIFAPGKTEQLRLPAFPAQAPLP